jgi:hypothetical protein
MSSPITEKDLYECYCCKQTVDYQMRDDKSGICIRCYRCGDCGCNCEEMDDEDERESKEADEREECPDDEECPGDEEDYDYEECCDPKCAYSGHWYKKEQRCPCGLTLSDDDLALESGKCEGCTMKDN